MDLRSALLAVSAVGLSGLVVVATTAGARGAGVEVAPIDLGPAVGIAETLPGPAETRTADGVPDPVLPAPPVGADAQVDDAGDDAADDAGGDAGGDDGDRAPRSDDASAVSGQEGASAPVRRAPAPAPKPAPKPAAPAPAPADGDTDDDERRGSGGDRDDDADDRADEEQDRADDAEDARDDADDDRDDLDD